MTAHERYIWFPQFGPQYALCSCPYDEIFYGGARGGGKTDGVLGKFATLAVTLARGFNGLFCRRELPMLDDAIERSKAIYGPLGARWHEQAKTWRFPEGGRLRFRPLERVEDADKYQGQNVSHACVEEAGQYPDSRPIDRLFGILRSAVGVRPQLILTGNPGGAGQAWIRARYIDPAPGGYTVMPRVVQLPEWAGGGDYTIKSIFIPSRVSDNKYLGAAYVAGLHLVGSAALVKAWLEGDWTAVEGAFFDKWQSVRNVCRPFDIPDHWQRFRSFDWGYERPFSVGWWAIASEDWSAPGLAGLRLIIPRGCMIRYREWYGNAGPNAGIRMEAPAVAKGIANRERGEHITYAVADTQVFAQEGRSLGYMGPTIGEQLNITLARMQATTFRSADKSRRQGWEQVRERILGIPEGAMLVVFDTCTDFIRTVPVLQHDQIDPEDLDTDAEDHIADEARYGCMSRPWAQSKPEKKEMVVSTALPTLASVVELTRQKRGSIGSQRIG